MNPERPRSVSASDFDGTRLTVARRLQGLTKAELARSLQVTPTAIAQYEKGSRPTQATLAQICLTLGMPRDFFGAGATPELLPASSAHFRSLRSTTSKAREQVLAYGELSLQLVDLIADYIDFPPVDLPDLDLPAQLTVEVIEDAASQLRAHWHLEPGARAVHCATVGGARGHCSAAAGASGPRVDALSTWAGKRPLVFLSRSKEDKARSRFDGAHELGHLLLHPDTEPGSKLVESEANAFASELLMPKRADSRATPQTHRLAHLPRPQEALGGQSSRPCVPRAPAGTSVRRLLSSCEPAARLLGPARTGVARSGGGVSATAGDKPDNCSSTTASTSRRFSPKGGSP